GAECLLWVQKGDDRRDARQWASNRVCLGLGSPIVRAASRLALRATARCAAAALTRLARRAFGTSDGRHGVPASVSVVQLLPSRSIALRVVSILRITATIATFGFLPAAMRRWWKVRSAGLDRNAARAGM